MNRRCIHTILMLIAVLGLSQSCIKDDRDDCEHVSLYFRYLADTTVNVLPDYMDRVDLYVYNEQNALVQTRTYSKHELKNCETPKFRLEPGDYHVLVVGNQGERTRLVNYVGGALENMYFTHPSLFTKATPEAISGFDPNYVGHKDIHVPANVSFRDTVQMHCSHIDVDVTIRNLHDEGEASQYEEFADGYSLVFEHAYSQTSALNQVGAQETTVIPRLSYDGPRLEYTTVDLNLYRFGLNSPLVMSIVNNNTGQVVSSESMNSFLARYPRLHTYLNREEAFLPILITFRHGKVWITPPFWLVEDINPDWGFDNTTYGQGR